MTLAAVAVGTVLAAWLMLRVGLHFSPPDPDRSRRPPRTARSCPAGSISPARLDRPAAASTTRCGVRCSRSRSARWPDWRSPCSQSRNAPNPRLTRNRRVVSRPNTVSAAQRAAAAPSRRRGPMSTNLPPTGPPSGPPPRPPPSGRRPARRRGRPRYLEQGGGGPCLRPAAAASGGGGRKWLIVGGVVGGLALGGGGVRRLHLADRRPAPQPAEALPGNTLGYVSVDLDPSGSQKIDAIRTLKKFPALKEWLDEAGSAPATTSAEVLLRRRSRRRRRLRGRRLRRRHQALAGRPARRGGHRPWRRRGAGSRRRGPGQGRRRPEQGRAADRGLRRRPGRRSARGQRRLADHRGDRRDRRAGGRRRRRRPALPTTPSSRSGPRRPATPAS